MSLENKDENEKTVKLRGRRHRATGFEEWGGYMASKKMKLAAQFVGQRDIEVEDQDDIKSDLFKGISIFVNGYTKPSADELRRLMLVHGGIYNHYYSSAKTTYTIASNLPFSKIKNLKNQIVLKPDWITESIKAGKLLPYQDFLLYTPEVMHKQQRLRFESSSRIKLLEEDPSDCKTSNVKTNTTILPHDSFEEINSFNCELSKNLLQNTNSQSDGSDDKSASINMVSKSSSNNIIVQSKSSFSTPNMQPNNPVSSGTELSKTLCENVSMQSESFSAEESKDLTLQDNVQSKSSSASVNVQSKSSSASVNVQSKSSSASVNVQSKSSSASVNVQSKNSSISVNAQSKSSINATSPSKNAGPVTAGHPAFLSEFYSHSRLHHISSAGQELKRYVQNLVDNHGTKTFSARENLKNLVKSDSFQNSQKHDGAVEATESAQRVIMHLDMDCFFVSVGLRNHPELKGKPVAVTHSKGKRGGVQKGSDVQYEAAHYKNQSKKKVEGLTSVEHDLSDNEHTDEEELDEKQKISKYSKEYGSLSEIASCSYEARKAGVRNGMFLGEALRRCPELKSIPYDFEGYSEVSKQLYDIVASYTLDIEAVSCDELFIDCTELLQDTGISPLKIASVFRTEIEEKTKCTASAGLGANMLLARLANRTAKPNGQFYVTNDQIDEFMKRQKVKDLPGVGYSTSIKFEQMGVITCEDLQKWSLSKLQQEFGPKTGQTLFKRCRGKDDRNVQLQKERKSVSAEINYGIRFEKEDEIFNFLKELSVEVVNRLHNINCKGKCITLKLMIRRPDAPVQTAKFMGHGVCDHIAKSISLKIATDDSVLIGRECCALARSLKIKPEDYRGIGIQLSKLESALNATKGHKSIESFASSIHNKGVESHTNREIFAPKELEPATKPISCSIKSFLSDKHLPKKQQIYEPPVLSVDQIDHSVLNSLPKDLQKEVLESYSTTSEKSVSSAQNSCSSFRGGMSETKSNKPVSKKSASVSQAKNKMPSKQNTLLDCMVPEKNRSNSDKDKELVLKNRATLGGAENINEIRSLIKEWVLSSQVMLEEDIDQFKDFLLQVIDEDLKKVDLILRYFYRVVSTANTLWQQAYLTILSYVQQKMLQNYGTMLEAESEFSKKL